MHIGLLAQESATLASVLSLVFGVITAYAYHLGFRAHWLLFGAAGLWGLALYFGMLAVSAGPAPIVLRGDIALPLRSILLLTFALLAIAFGMILFRLWRGAMRHW